MCFVPNALNLPTEFLGCRIDHIVHVGHFDSPHIEKIISNVVTRTLVSTKSYWTQDG